MLLAALALAVLQPAVPPPGPEPAGPPASPQPAPKPEDLTALPVESLIARLPPCGGEFRYDGSEYKLGPECEEMARRVKAGLLTDDQWRQALLKTGAIRARELWPEKEPYLLSLDVPAWVGFAQIRLKPRLDTLRPAEVGELLQGISGTFAMIDARDAKAGRPIGVLPKDCRELIFDVEIERGTRLFDEPRKDEPPILWKGELRRPISLVKSWEEAVPAESSPTLDKAVRASIGAGVRAWADNPAAPYAVIDPDCDAHAELAALGLDLKIELVKEGKVLAESVLVAVDHDGLGLASSCSKARTRFYGSTNFELPTSETPKDDWILRLRGVGDHAWALWHAKTRWGGSVEMTWKEAVDLEKSRCGPQGRGPELSTPHWR